MLKPTFEVSAIARKEDFRAALREWFLAVGKDYPWRRTDEPYRVLVSEVMLQQTQVATVLGRAYYTNFLVKFPDVHVLAAADDEELLKAWEGLGYYRRARMLRETARTVVEKHGGVFPDHEKELLELPGIGPYTAAALTAFSFKEVSGLVDGNVSRIFSRIFADPSPIDTGAVIRSHRQMALELCDPEHPDTHHHAMMELGQRICRPGRPDCLHCPVARFCRCRDPETLPNKKRGAKITDVEENAIFARHSDGRILLHKEAGERRTGLWKLPLRKAEFFRDMDEIYKARYQITRYRVSLRVFQLPTDQEVDLETGDEWVSENELEKLPFAAPFRKAIKHLYSEF